MLLNQKAKRVSYSAFLFRITTFTGSPLRVTQDKKKGNYPTLPTKKMHGKDDTPGGILGHELLLQLHQWPIWKTAAACLDRILH